MKTLAVVSLLFLTLDGVATAAVPSATQIIQTEGRLAFRDGSSYYLFKKDGTFYSLPLSIYGRLIDGHWKVDNDRFVVQGVWSRINGIFSTNDVRTMTLFIYPVAVAPKVTRPNGSERAFVYESSGPEKLYECYFVVQGIVTVAPPPPKRRTILAPAPIIIWNIPPKQSDRLAH